MINDLSPYFLILTHLYVPKIFIGISFNRDWNNLCCFTYYFPCQCCNFWFVFLTIYLYSCISPLFLWGFCIKQKAGGLIIYPQFYYLFERGYLCSGANKYY